MNAGFIDQSSKFEEQMQDVIDFKRKQIIWIRAALEYSSLIGNFRWRIN